MNRRNFFTRAAQAVAGLAVVPFLGSVVPDMGSRPFVWFRQWITFDELCAREQAYFDKNLIANLKAQTSVFEAMASRRKLPVNAGMQREFFRYEP